jgi:hypothetical protein
MKAVRVDHAPDCGLENESVYIMDAGMVQMDLKDPCCIIVRAIDESNHVVGKPIRVDFGLEVRRVEEVDYVP